MITAWSYRTNVILSISTGTPFLLQRKKGRIGEWLSWDGNDWVSVSTLLLTDPNFTDYNLESDVYQYRYTSDSGVNYIGSNCVIIGTDHVGWSFDNYDIPEGQFGEILTSDDLRFTFLWGVSFTASNAEQWANEQTKKCIEWAVFQLEKTLNIDIFPKEYYSDDEDSESIEETKYIKKEFPYSAVRKRNFLIRLNHRPVREVTRFDWVSPVDTKIASLMPWKRLDMNKGYLWFYPRNGQITAYSGYVYPWNLMLQYSNYQGGYHVDYKTGYKNAGLIPEDLREIIGKISALKMLNIIGDGLIAGFSSSSLSLDGMSESFSSTQSATSAFFGARIKVYQDEVKEYIKENKWKYSNVPIGSI